MADERTKLQVTGFTDTVQRGARVIRPQLASLVLDILFVFYLLISATYCYSQLVLGEEHWFLIPWWLLVIIAAEISLLWQTFGISPGMRVARIRLHSLKRPDERATFGQRLVRFIMFHAFGYPLFGIFPSLWNQDQTTFYDQISRCALRRDEGSEESPRSWYHTSTGIAAALIVVFTLTAAVYITQIKLDRLISGAARVGPVFRTLLTPDWSIAGEGISLLVITLFMSLLATLFGVVVAVPLSFLAARNLMTGPLGRLIYTIVRIIMSITRSIEPLIWAVIFVAWVRLGPFPGMLALWVHSIADLTKLYSERLESIDQGPVEAISAPGATRIQTIVYGIIPQIVNPYLSFTLYRWDINVRMSTIIGIVAGGGIGQQLYLYIRYWKWPQASMFMLLIIATIWAIDYISARLRARLEAGATGRRTKQSAQWTESRSRGLAVEQSSSSE
jgi:phosphonate transport system permease protein